MNTYEYVTSTIQRSSVPQRKYYVVAHNVYLSTTDFVIYRKVAQGVNNMSANREQKLKYIYNDM